MKLDAMGSNSKLGRWIEGVCWGVGLALIGGFALMQLWAEQARAQGVTEARRVLHLPAPSAEAQALWSEKRVSAYAQAAKDAPEAVLSIPSLELEVPVYGDASEINLNRGAGHITGTAALQESGNVGIAAHRDGFFRKLKDASLEDVVLLEHAGGVRRYRVVEIQIVEPEQLTVLAPTPVPSITLVTCYPFYFVGNAPQRYIVRAEIDETHRPTGETLVNWNTHRRKT